MWLVEAAKAEGKGKSKPVPEPENPPKSSGNLASIIFFLLLARASSCAHVGSQPFVKEKELPLPLLRQPLLILDARFDSICLVCVWMFFGCGRAACLHLDLPAQVEYVGNFML